MNVKITERYKDDNAHITIEKVKEKGVDMEDDANRIYIEYRQGKQDLQDYFEQLEDEGINPETTTIEIDPDIEDMILYDNFILSLF